MRDPPIVGVAGEHGTDTRLPAHELEGARSVRLLREVRFPVRHDPDRLLGEEAAEVADRALENELHLERRDLVRRREVKRLETGERLGLVLRIRDVAQRIEDVVRRERLAAVEGDTGPNLELPDRALRVALDRLGKPRPRNGVRVVLEEALVHLLGPRRSRVDRDVPGSERVAGATVVHADPKMAATPRRGGGRASTRGGGAEESGEGQGRAERRRALEQLSPRESGKEKALVRGDAAHFFFPFLWQRLLGPAGHSANGGRRTGPRQACQVPCHGKLRHTMRG